jgi:hypothetical protein
VEHATERGAAATSPALHAAPARAHLPAFILDFREQTAAHAPARGVQSVAANPERKPA